jgi:CRISPR-associated protein Cas1
VLSFVYALLVKELTIVLQAVGFDPLLGIFHRPRFGRPGLALDCAAEYRPLIGYRISYRRVLEVQARLLARVFTGELPEYIPFTTR